MLDDATTIRFGHPLGGHIRLLAAGGDHVGLNSAILDTDERDRTLFVWRSARRHAPERGSEIRLSVSHDEGLTLTEQRTIFCDPDWDTRNFAAARMTDGRVGLVCTRFRLGERRTVEVHPGVFLFSDDGGRTWSHRDLPLPAPDAHVNFHGAIVAGEGHGAFFAASYNTPAGEIDGLSTKDNGETWHWARGICRPDGILSERLTETAVARLGQQGPWLLVARPTVLDQSMTAVAFLSRDLETWDGPFDTGLPLNANAPALLVEGDRAYFYTVSRRGRGRELGIEHGARGGNRLLVADAPVAGLIETNGRFGAFGGWREVTRLPEAAVGYLFPGRIGGRWAAVVNFGESSPVGTHEPKSSMLGLIIPHVPAVVDAGALAGVVPQDDLLDNGDFRGWRADHSSGPAAWTVLPGGTSSARIAADAPGSVGRTWLRIGPGGGECRLVQRLTVPRALAGARLTLAFRARASGGARVEGASIATPDASRVLQFAGPVHATGQPLFFSLTGHLPADWAGDQAAFELSVRMVLDGEDAALDISSPSLAASAGVGPLRVPSPAEAELRLARRYMVVETDLVAVGPPAAGVFRFEVRPPAPMAFLPMVRVLGEHGRGADRLRVDGGGEAAVRLLHICRERIAGLAAFARPGSTARMRLELDADPGRLDGRTWQREDGRSSVVRTVGGDVAWTSVQAVDADAVSLGAACDADAFDAQVADAARLEELREAVLDAVAAGGVPDPALVAERAMLTGRLRRPG